MEYIELNYLCKSIKKIRSNQGSILISSFSELEVFLDSTYIEYWFEKNIQYSILRKHIFLFKNLDLALFEQRKQISFKIIIHVCLHFNLVMGDGKVGQNCSVYVRFS